MQQPILEGIHITKQLGHISILRDVSLQVFPGEIFGIIGPSGAGKSSLLKCLCSMDLAHTGTLRLGDTLVHASLSAKELRAVRQRLGLVSQQYHLIESKTVEQNVTLPLRFDGNEDPSFVQELLDLVGLSKKKDAYPAMLSGGEKQRAAIVRALIRRPAILFCDEITSALDAKKTEEILQLLEMLRKTLSLAIVFVTHDLHAASKLCHSIGVLDHGLLVEQQPTLDLFISPQHAITKHLLQSHHPDIDLSLFQDEDLLFVRLHFMGNAAKAPFLSKMISSLHVEINILCGWMELVKNTPVGSLTIALSGELKQEALSFCAAHHIRYEVLS